jgi:hypothetical protein
MFCLFIKYEYLDILLGISFSHHAAYMKQCLVSHALLQGGGQIHRSPRRQKLSFLGCIAVKRRIKSVLLVLLCRSVAFLARRDLRDHNSPVLKDRIGLYVIFPSNFYE